MLIVSTMTALSVYAQAKPEVEFLFNGDLKNTGTLGGEGKFLNPVTGEEACFGEGMNIRCLDVTRTKGGSAEKASDHGGAVIITAKGIDGAKSLSVSGVIYAATKDDLPRRIVSVSPLLQVYVQSGGMVCAVANAKNETKWFGAKMIAEVNKPIFFTIVVDSEKDTVTAYQLQRGALVKTASEGALPVDAKVIGGYIEIGNMNKQRPFKGFIDNIRIFTSALAEGDINAVMTADRSSLVLPSPGIVEAKDAPERKADAGKKALPPLENGVLVDPDKSSKMPPWKIQIVREGVRGNVLPAVDGNSFVTKLNYSFVPNAANNVYIKLVRGMPTGVDDSSGLTFSYFAADPKITCFVRLSDNTGQTHQHTLKIPAAGWQKVSLAFDKTVFTDCWGGDGSGAIKFPVRSLSIDIYKGSADSPDGTFQIKETMIHTFSFNPHAVFGIAIENDLPSGVAFVGERAVYRVSVMNRRSLAINTELVVKSIADDKTVNERRFPLSFKGLGETITKEILFPTDVPRFFGISAYLAIEGIKAGRTRSGLSVVNKIASYGKDDPKSFFGSMHVHEDPHALDRIGCKNYREFYWFLPWTSKDASKYDFSELDKRIDSARERGIGVVICPEVNFQYIPTNWGMKEMSDIMKPEIMEIYRAHIRVATERYKGKIAGIEVQNEPNNEICHVPGYTIEKGAEIYAAMIKAAHEEIRSVAPNMPILALDVSGRDFHTFAGADPEKVPGDFKFTKAVLPLTKGMFDINSAHPYSHNRIIRQNGKVQFPEEMDLRGKFILLGDLMEQHGFPRRIWTTEIGYSILGDIDPPDDMTTQYAAIVGQGLAICKSVPGLEKCYWFITHYHNPTGDDYGLFHCNLPQRAAVGHECPDTLFPTPMASTFAASAYMLHDSSFVREVTCNDTVSAWRFDRNDGKSVVAFWSKKDGEFILSMTAPTSTEAVNSVGRRIAGGATLSLGYNRLPLYVTSPKKDADALEKAFASAKVIAAEPLMVRKVYLSDDRTVTAVVENTVGRPVDGVFEAGGKRMTRTFTVSGEDTVSVALPSAVTRGDTLSLAVSAEIMKKSFVVPTDLVTVGYIATPRIDGTLDETKMLTPVTLDNRNFLYPPDAPWKGTNDLSVEAYIGWNDDGLYFAARVRDDVHAAPFDGPKESWKSDSIQLAIDRSGDSMNAYNDDDREVGLVIGEHGASASLYIVGKYWGELKAETAGKHADGVTVYEALLPWNALKLDAPKAGTVMGINFIVNENDGLGRMSWMGFTPGIGEAKAPINYKPFHFVR